MKFIVFLLAVAGPCLADKEHDGIGCSDDMSYFYGWLVFLKRLFMVLTVLGFVVLYYVPRSRSYARRGCLLLIDGIANSLKSAIGAPNDSYKMRNNFFNESEKILRIHGGGRSIYNDLYAEGCGDFPNLNIDQGNKIEAKLEDERKTEKGKQNDGHGKEERRGHRRHHNRHSHGSGKTVLKEVPYLDLRKCLETPLDFYSGASVDLPTKNEYYRHGLKGCDDAETCAAVLISGSPREMAMIEQKCEREDVVIMEDPRPVLDNKRKIKPINKPREEDYPEKGPTGDNVFTVAKETNEEDNSLETFGSKTKFNEDDMKFPQDCLYKSRDANQTRPGDAVAILENDLSSRCTDRSSRLEDNGDRIDWSSKSADFHIEGNSSKNEGSIKSRRVNFIENEVLEYEKIEEHSADENSRSNSEEVLTQLGDQIQKLDETIRMMRPSSRRKGSKDDGKEVYALQAIETVLKDIKRGFREFDDKVRRRRRSRTARMKIERNRNRVKEENYFQDQLEEDADFRDEMSKVEEDEEEPQRSRPRAPKILDSGENRLPANKPIMPAVMRALSWLFSECPNHGNSQSEKSGITPTVLQEPTRC